MSRPKGIGGKKISVDPVGAVLRVGLKGPRGNPIDRDRFTICSPHEADGVRPLHESFAVYNNAKPELRRNLRARLVHGRLGQAFDLQRYAWTLPQHQRPPNKKPVCEGDGKRAIRYKDGDFRDIKCPADLCEYWQCGACKPRLSLLFRPEWNDPRLPALLMRYSSRGQHMVSGLYGLWDLVAIQAYQFGLLPEEPAPGDGWEALDKYRVPVYGLPFTITLADKTGTVNGKGVRFPVVHFAPDGDLMEWFIATHRRMQELAPGPEVKALPPHSVEDDTPEIIAAEVEDLEPGIPGTLFDGGHS